MLPTFEAFADLACLQLNDNHLRVLPAGLTALTKLEVLDCAMNEITEVGAPPSLCACACVCVMLMLRAHTYVGCRSAQTCVSVCRH
jgi:Leucine-rich repeat (LRR) protein